MAEDSAIPDERMRVLADGCWMPILGLGVWQVPNGPECVNAVRWALELGYRHIDTAQAYGNEESVGRACATAVSPRGGLHHHQVLSRPPDPAAEAEKPAAARGRPGRPVHRALAPARSDLGLAGDGTGAAAGYTRSIGVSNFSVERARAGDRRRGVPPAVNQVQFSPFEYRRALLEACEEHDVALEAYSPLGTGRHLADPAVTEIAGAWGGRRPRSCCAGACSGTRS